MPTLSFVPQRFNVVWDGVSCAEASFNLSVAGPYAATAYQVFDRSGEYANDETGESLESYRQGDRFFTLAHAGGSYTVETRPTQSLTVSTTGQVATVVFSSLEPGDGLYLGDGRVDPNTYYSWMLRVVSGPVLVAGRIDVKPHNAFVYTTPGSIKFASGYTAANC